MRAERDTYTDFLEQVKIKGSFYMPAKEHGGVWPLIIEGNVHEEWLRTEDGKEHVLPMPCLTLRELYRQCEGRFHAETFRGILADYVEVFQKASEQDAREQELLSEVMEKFPAERLIAVLIPPDADMKEMAGRFPGRACGTAYLLYAVIMEEQGDTIRAMTVTEDMAKHWETDEKTLYQAVIKTMSRRFLYEIEELALPGRRCFIVKSETRCFGLTALLYEDGPLEELAAQSGQDLIVMTLSIHEAAVFPAAEWKEEEVKALAEGVSAFGNTVWRYHRKRKRLAFTDREWQECIESLKYGIRDAAEGRSRE